MSSRDLPYWASAKRAVFPVIALLLVLSGCTRIKVRLGWKMHIENIPISSIAVNLAKGSGIAPGEKSPLVVTFNTPDGKVLRTEGAGHGKVLWKDLKIEATVVTANQKGTVFLDADPRISEGKVGHVTVTVPSHPNLRADLDIPVRYDYAYSMNFSGSDGSSGMNGTDGTNGMSGSTGSIDPNNPSPGGDGGNGGDGSNGQDGGAGGDAPDVQIRVALRAGSHPLLQAKVSGAGREQLYLLDPQRGSLTVSADGGRGGSGGRGGHGGRGGSGGIGTPNGSSGRNGSDGHNGSDGSDGRGGRITVIYDPEAKPYLSVIHLASGNGPRPIYKEEPVASLW